METKRGCDRKGRGCDLIYAILVNRESRYGGIARADDRLTGQSRCRWDLTFRSPVALTNTLVDVKLTMEPVKKETDIPSGRRWPPGFFEETFGSCQDDPLIIDFEGEFEDREALL